MDQNVHVKAGFESSGERSSSRRQFLITSGILGAGLLLSPRNLFAQDESPVVKIRKEAATAKLKVHPLRGNISVIEGSGGNVAVFTGKDGKLLVDAGIDLSKAEMTKALSQISDKPVKQLINTHWHFDHTDGNEWLHNEGAVITAHENTRKHLDSTVTVKDWSFTFPPAAKGALPAATFKSGHSIRFNEKEVVLKYYGPAHTDGDISVYFPDEDILHVGDTLWNGFYPFIDYSTGGNIDGMIRAAEANLKAATEKTIVIPGHGPVGDRNTLLEFHDMLTAIRQNVARLKKQGRSASQVVDAKPTKEYDAKWGGFVIDPAFFTKLVYRGV